MADNYKVHKAWISEAEFEILILEIPISEIEDKLAYLARDKGNISKNFYEDFVIATCIANINQLLFQIKQQSNQSVNLMAIREDVMIKALSINPSLDPSNLIINRNSVIKLRTKAELEEGERLLTENKGWDTLYYEDPNNNVQKNNAPDVVDIPKEDIIEKKNDKKETPEIKDIDDLPFSVVKQWWKRINKYIEVKKYEDKYVDSILSKKFFHNRSSFQTYVVSTCLVDSEDLFTMLDNMGLPSRVAPPILMHEVYELCREVNPALTYETAQELMDKSDLNDEAEPTTCKGPSGNNRMASHAKQQQQSKKKKDKKTFKDVSKDELLKLGDTMKVFVIGQDSAVDQIVESIQRASVGLKDPIKPIGSFLFAGRTGCGKCVEKGTLIFTEQGVKTIDSFADKEVGDKEFVTKLYGLNGPNYTSHIYNEGKKPGIRITTDKGFKLGGSLVHPVVSMSADGSLIFKRLEELTDNDYVAIQYNQNFFCAEDKITNFEFAKVPGTRTKMYKAPKVMNPDLALFIGLILGDNGIHNGEDVITFNSASLRDTRLFNRLAKKLFDVPVGDGVGSLYCRRINSKYVCEFIKLCGASLSYSKDRSIPSSILESSKESIASFIKGITLGNGIVKLNSMRPIVRIGLESETMIDQLRIVLLNFGIMSDKKYREADKSWFLDIFDRYMVTFLRDIMKLQETKIKKVLLKRIDTTVIPLNSDKLLKLLTEYNLYDDLKLQYEVGCSNGYKLRKHALLNILARIKNIVGEKINDNNVYNHLLNLANLDVVWMRVSNIEKVDEMELYDFTVPGDHTYASNGFVSHNTSTCKVLANELIKDRNNLVTIDCSEYSADHEYSKLIGAPQGYIGYEQGGHLTNAITENPFSVVVFDEIEKASHKVHELMLQILEEGRLTDGKGQKVSFKDTVIIMTSNIGVTEVEEVKKAIGFGDAAKITEDKKNRAIDKAIKKKFKPEFINRIDSIVYFNSLTKRDYLRIIDIELYRLNENLKTNDTEFKELTLEFDNKVKAYIYKHGIDEDYGARPLKRCIEKHVSTPLANRLLKGDINMKATVLVTVRQGKIDFNIKEVIEEDVEEVRHNVAGS